MCKIEEVPGFRLHGRLYESMDAAIDAGLTEIGNDLQRNHATATKPGLLKHRDALIYLLGLHAQANPTPVEARKDPPAEKDPLTPEQAYGRRSGLLGRLQAWAQTEPGKTKAKQFITAGGYNDLADLNTRASAEDIEKMHGELDELGVA